jgi:hypothetical protein
VKRWGAPAPNSERSRGAIPRAGGVLTDRFSPDEMVMSMQTYPRPRAEAYGFDFIPVGTSGMLAVAAGSRTTPRGGRGADRDA